MTADPSDPPPSPAPPPPRASESITRPRSTGARVAVHLGVFAAIVVIYVLTLAGVRFLATSAPALPAVDLSQHAAEDTIVQVRLEELKTVADRLRVDVLAYPKDSLYDKDFGVLTTDATVRLYPNNDLGDLQYPKGKAPAQVTTTIEAQGDPSTWPFDSYKTGIIEADVFTGAGQNREKVPARIEVVGSLDGWDATVTRVQDSDEPDPNIKDDVIITLHRSKNALVFDVGICLVLAALPTLALWVAIPMALGRTSFLAPLGTWYAAMLFAVVPLRNIFPGSPPPGSWIDQAFVLWVLIALVIAMTFFVAAWTRQRDRNPPRRP